MLKAHDTKFYGQIFSLPTHFDDLREWKNKWMHGSATHQKDTLQNLDWKKLKIWGSADKSLALPGSKLSTATKLGIYST
jgi:uncharacterized protein YjdB